MSALLSAERLAEIAARIAAATRGPWETDTIPGPGGGIGVASEGDFDLWVIPVQDLDPADAAFIAAARTDVPALLADVARLKAELDSAVKVIVELHKLINSSGAAPAGGGK